MWTTERLDPSSLPEELQSLISHSRYNIIEYFTEEYKGAFISYKLKDDKVSEFSFQNKHESEENFLNYFLTDICSTSTQLQKATDGQAANLRIG